MRARPAASGLAPYLLVAPALACLAVFKFGPVLHAVWLSTFDWRLGSTAWRAVGLGNYRKLLAAPEFWNALHNTALYSLGVGTATIGLGLALALALGRLVRLAPVYQATFFLPVAATMSAMAVVWKFMLDATVGVLHAVAVTLGAPPANWLQDGAAAMLVVMVVGVWSNLGYALVLFQAGLTAIPAELHEAAALDGATAAQRFRWVTWPLLSPTTLFVVVIVTLRAVQAFDAVRILTDGGPLGATQVLSHLLYQVGFQFFDTGYASGIAVLFFVLLVAVTLVQMRTERLVHYR